jgi:mitogen-activated protein kinase 1/3
MSDAQNCEPHRLPSDFHEAFDTWKLLSESAHRVVYSAVHRSSGVKVTIKVLRPFDNVSLCVRTLNEVKLLRHFSHPNIVLILGVEKQYDYGSFNEVYIIQEFMDTDLKKVIQTRELSNDHCQYFIWQMLCALDAIHFAGVLHRDLTPSNILINENCDLKVGDFSLARSEARIQAEQGSTREYVTNPWYRAPEIILAFAQYTNAVDIWSLGCIFAEMLNGTPLFPGRDVSHQLNLIFDVLGTPTKEDNEWILSSLVREELCCLPSKEKIPWKNIFPDASADALDLVEPAGRPIPGEFFDFDEGKNNQDMAQLKSEVTCPYLLLEPLVDFFLRTDLRGGDALAIYRGCLTGAHTKQRLLLCNRLQSQRLFSSSGVMVEVSERMQGQHRTILRVDHLH